jgi:hypothetical protein
MNILQNWKHKNGGGLNLRKLSLILALDRFTSDYGLSSDTVADASRLASTQEIETLKSIPLGSKLRSLRTRNMLA